MRIRTWFTMMIVATVLVGCDNEDSAAAPDDEASAETKSDDKKINAPKSNRKTRVVSTKSLGVDGTGDKRQFRFALTNDGKKEIQWAQTWVYYYDDKGKCVSRYPHSIMPKIKPGATAEKNLGFDGKKFKKEFVSADVEISSVKWADGTRWANENLVQGTSERSVGGPSHAELMKLEGEKVTGKWTGDYGEDDKPVFELTNVSGKALTVKTLWIYYYGADGKSLHRDVANLSLKLKAGATVKHETGTEKSKLKKGVKHIEPSVSRVKVGGKAWENRNLARTDRPMQGKAGD